MRLSHLITEYVAYKQAIGMRYRAEAKLFRTFLRAVGDLELAVITPQQVEGFLRVRGSVTTVWHLRYTVLKGLFRYASERGHLEFAPLPKTRPKRLSYQKPHIYSTEELRRLLDATATLQTRMSPLQALTFRTLFLMLYGTGLRISEALALTLADVDLGENLLKIQDAKFYKSRLVPVGDHLAEHLRAYRQRRQDFPCPSGDNSAFFATRFGHRFTYHRADEIFRRMRKQAGIGPPRGALEAGPRLHDLRHTSAVHHVEAWYRAGADVQRLLPILATYLGHVGIQETQHYLTMTPELLRQANALFERYALPHGGRP